MAFSHTFKEGDEQLLDRRLEDGSTEPLIVLTGTGAEYDEFLSSSKRSRSTSIAITSAHQFDFYPGHRVCHYGTYWLNPAFESSQYTRVMEQFKLEDLGL